MMATTEVIKLECPDGSYLFPVLICSAAELFLIDCGYQGQLDQLSDGLQKCGRTLEQLTGVIITHHDIDHMGGLCELKKVNPGIRVLASGHEAPYIDGTRPSLRLQQARAMRQELSGKKLEEAKKFEQFLQSVQSCRVDMVLNEGKTPFTFLEILATPGHTPGHISVYLPQGRTLIAADALVWENSAFGIANPDYAMDLDAAILSVKRIRDLKPERIICYHGGQASGNIDQLLAELVYRYR